ncbi:MAG: ATP-binding protein [Actinomycetota bacterium]|nr:ATP-binding protein [Actinomycetota bacterium]
MIRHLADAVAPRAARTLIRKLLCNEPPEAIEVAVLLTSELVANAVVHGRGEAVLEVTYAPACGLLRVRVGDHSHEVPVLRHPSLSQDHGRGIAIVEHFSSCWGIDGPGAEGKCVWFELQLPRAERGEGSWN